ncbi:MAG: ParA family protein [Bacteroidetes bacterium]|nr:ParA family protein [Bacteroidota bacterium]
MAATIISVANMKGGVGKTTISLFLAAALAIEKKRKVLYLDCDFQRSAFDYREHEKSNVYAEGEEPPYPIERVSPKYIYDEVRYNEQKYDIIFIDIPRITDTSDSDVVTVLTYCHHVLIPIVAGELEALSMKRFIEMVKGIAAYKNEKGHLFSYYSFLNKRNRRKENDDALEYMKSLGVPVFKNSLSDVKALSKPYTYESILATAEGKRRFQPFFKEFISTFNL